MIQALTVSCVRQCSRTTGGPTIRNAILGFLEAFPTPSAVLEASDKELEVVIGPLGLQEVRRKALQRMSYDFFAKVGGAGFLPPWVSRVLRRFAPPQGAEVHLCSFRWHEFLLHSSMSRQAFARISCLAGLQA